MATSYVEEAILRVNDQSTKKLRKINTEIKRLIATARSVNKVKLNLGDMRKTERDVQSLERSVRNLSRELRSIPAKKTIRFAVIGGKAALRDARALRNAAGNMNQRVNFTSNGDKVVAEIRRIKAMSPIKIIVNYDERNRPRPLPVPPPGRPNGPVPPGGNRNSRGGYGGYGFFGGVAADIGYGAARGGGNDYLLQDTADSNLRLQGRTEQEISSVNAVASNLASESEAFSQARIANLLAEQLVVAKGDLSIAQVLAEQTLRMADVAVAQGKTAAEALDGAISYSKAAEQMNRVFDDQGDVDLPKLTSFFDTLLQGQIGIGREFTPDQVAQLVKYLKGGSKATVTDDALLKLLFVAEEMRASTAGTQYTSALRNLSGTRTTKRALGNMEQFGLIETGTVPAGEIGDLSILEVVGRQMGGSQETQAADLFRWVDEYVIPAMKANGFDPDNATSTQDFASLITSNTNAADLLVNMINRQDDYARGFEQARNFDVSPENVGTVLGGSGSYAIQSVQSQVASAIGQALNQLEPALIPLADKFAEGAEGLATRIAKENKTTEEYARLTTDLSKVGMVAGLAAAMDPATRPLGLAAAGLSAAGTLLGAAAESLLGYVPSFLKTDSATIASNTAFGAASADAQYQLNQLDSQRGKLPEGSPEAVALQNLADSIMASGQVVDLTDVGIAGNSPQDGHIISLKDEIASLNANIATVQAGMDDPAMADNVFAAQGEGIIAGFVARIEELTGQLGAVLEERDKVKATTGGDSIQGGPGSDVIINTDRADINSASSFPDNVNGYDKSPAERATDKVYNYYFGDQGNSTGDTLGATGPMRTEGGAQAEVAKFQQQYDFYLGVAARAAENSSQNADVYAGLRDRAMLQLTEAQNILSAVQEGYAVSASNGSTGNSEGMFPAPAQNEPFSFSLTPDASSSLDDTVMRVEASNLSFDRMVASLPTDIQLPIMAGFDNANSIFAIATGQSSSLLNGSAGDLSLAAVELTNAATSLSNLRVAGTPVQEPAARETPALNRGPTTTAE